MKKTCVICGYGFIGKKLGAYLKEYGLADRVVYCDNSKYKQSNDSEHEVLSVESAVLQFPDAEYRPASAHHSTRIKKQLLCLGIKEKNIVMKLPEKVRKIYIDDVKSKRLTPIEDFKFEVDLTDHCNLNCKGCSLFAPLSKKSFLDLDELDKDYDRIAELFNGGDDVKKILLLGGEPLLHPEIRKSMEITRSHFNKAEIDVVTNGILLCSEPEAFWTSCHDNDITITPTWYPINVDYDKAEKIAKDHDVKYHFYNNSAAGGRTLIHAPLDINGTQNAEDNYLSCLTGNECIELRNHRFWTCSVPTHYFIFDKYFDKKIPLNPDDGIDIYKAKNQQEIRDFLAKPRSFCRYCKPKEWTYDNPWETSKKKIEEWT